jgi:SecD/SecF fusion protein
MSNRRSHLILVGLILAALAGVALLAIPGSPAHKKVTLGLDLQGGLEVVRKAVPPPGKTCDSACMDRSVSIMRSRIDKLGVSEPEIRKQGNNQIVIQLAGVHDVNKAAQIIGTTAQLQFFDFEEDVFGPSTNAGQVVAHGSLYDLLTKVKADTKKGGSQYYLFNAKKQKVAGPEDTRQRLLNSTLPSGRQLKGELPNGFTVLAAPPKTIVVSCDQAATGCQGVQQADATVPTVYYLFKYDPNNPTNPIPEATGEDLKLSDIAADISTQGQGNVVRLGFTGKGADKFHDITRKEAQRGASLAAAAGQTGSDPNPIQQFA